MAQLTTWKQQSLSQHGKTPPHRVCLQGLPQILPLTGIRYLAHRRRSIQGPARVAQSVPSSTRADGFPEPRRPRIRISVHLNAAQPCERRHATSYATSCTSYARRNGAICHALLHRLNGGTTLRALRGARPGGFSRLRPDADVVNLGLCFFFSPSCLLVRACSAVRIRSIGAHRRTRRLPQVWLQRYAYSLCRTRCLVMHA
jgi:hypothetical protein